MPTIEVSKKDLCKLIGKNLPLEQLKDAVEYAKSEIESAEGDVLKLDVKDSNRPDLWSAEGLAREVQGRLGIKKGLPKYKIGKSKVIVKVEKKNAQVRPLTVCAVAKGLKLNDEALGQMIQLQEKVCGTFGRNREEVAIGVYDMTRIKSPIRFTTVKPDGIKFTPLEFRKEMTPAQILKEHPKGKEYGHLLKGCKEYPIFIDRAGEVLSVPPIINSNYTGKVTKRTKQIFIECSGFHFKFLVPALNVMVAALADRGAKIQSVKVVYPNKRMTTPDMSPMKSAVNVNYSNKVSGLNLSARQMVGLLERARYKASASGKKINVQYPAYRQDIMQQRDIVEDIIISYGYNNIPPVIAELPTIGGISKREVNSNTVANIMTGLGMQEILSYTLTNKENLFKRMNIAEEKIAEVSNPVSLNWNVFRNWMLPSVMEFLSNNKHVEYPQRVFEIGDVIALDGKMETKSRDVRKLACAIAGAQTSYQEISSVLNALMNNLGLKYKLKSTPHKSFIPNRVAEIIVGNKSVGFVGEISPLVLTNWKLEMPVVAFELDLEMIV